MMMMMMMMMKCCNMKPNYSNAIRSFASLFRLCNFYYHALTRDNKNLSVSPSDDGIVCKRMHVSSHFFTVW